MLDKNWDEIDKKLQENAKRLEALKNRIEKIGFNPNGKRYLEITGKLLNDLYCNLPVATDGLSFHDIDTNELAMMGIPWGDPTENCFIKANEIFVHTFLDDCTLDDCWEL